MSRRKAEEAEAAATAAPIGDEDGPPSDGSDVEGVEDDDIIDPVLPVEDDDPFNDEEDDNPPADAGIHEVSGCTHYAKVPDS